MVDPGSEALIEHLNLGVFISLQTTSLHRTDSDHEWELRVDWVKPRRNHMVLTESRKAADDGGKISVVRYFDGLRFEDLLKKQAGSGRQKTKVIELRRRWLAKGWKGRKENAARPQNAARVVQRATRIGEILQRLRQDEAVECSSRDRIST